MLRKMTISALLALAPVAAITAVPALAQNPAPTANPRQCNDTPAKKAKRSLFGGMLGSVAGSVLGSVGGVGSTVASVALPAGTLLTEELLKLLDCKEQQQAARATDEAIRGGVGTEVAWTSESRPNLSGKSTVTGQTASADGGTCMTVTDVVIVDGEETTVPKKMCRAKGASAFARV